MIRDRMPDLRASRSNSSTFGRGFLQEVHLQIAQNKKLKELLDQVRINTIKITRFIMNMHCIDIGRRNTRPNPSYRQKYFHCEGLAQQYSITHEQ